MAKYIKKPVIVEAFRFGYDIQPEWFNELIKIGDSVSIDERGGIKKCIITTPSIDMIANYGDYILNVNDKLHPCKPDIFEATYDRIKKEN